jgi:hypothetical protein
MVGTPDRWQLMAHRATLPQEFMFAMAPKADKSEPTRMTVRPKGANYQ